MKSNGQNIINELAVSLSLHDKTKDELKAITQRYPYFALSQFLLSNKMKNEQDEHGEKQMQKTAVYFSNPLWFQYLTTENEPSTEYSSNERLSLVQQPDEDFLEPNAVAEDDNLAKEIKNPVAEYLNESAQNSEVETDEMTEDEHEKLSKLIEQHLAEFKKPVEDNGEVPIETKLYHTIDYFASQGIKLELGKISRDLFGMKVKKFTDWLKQIKQANQNPTDLGTDSETEHLIEKIAQTSNETKDIVTETMAEVLLKQGKTEKAIQLYNKLSFLNPSKSTYFAAKINELKE